MEFKEKKNIDLESNKKPKETKQKKTKQNKP